MCMAKKGSPTRPKRAKRLHMLLSWEEWNMLLELCDEFGLTASDMVRQLIRQKDAKIQKGKRS